MRNDERAGRHDTHLGNVLHRESRPKTGVYLPQITQTQWLVAMRLYDKRRILTEL
jgi:hypothetical protein